MSLQTRIEKTRAAIRRRKRNRERKRALKQGGRARREARAIRKLRKVLANLLRPRPAVMYDSVTVSAIPKDAKAVAGYVNGAWPTWPDILAGWPHAERVSIAVTSSVLADCLDIEPGNADNGDAVGWYRRFKDAAAKNHTPGKKPIFYTSASNTDALVSTLTAAGIKRGAYILWTAHYGAGKHLCGPDTCRLTSHKADASQWTDSSHGRNLDESVCRRSFWERG